MMNNKKTAIIACSVVALILIIDQIVKILVKTNMYLYQHIVITDWFHIAFTENRGMAFGMEVFGGTMWENFGKIMLTVFRIIAALIIIWYIRKQIKKQAPMMYIILLSMVLAGDIGNVIDSMFYGMIFSASGYTPAEIATFVPFGQGYDDFLMGRVVDMFYFPLFHWTMPEIPLLSQLPFMPAAGEEHVFFDAIFNVADAAVSVAIISFILFYSDRLSVIGLNDEQIIEIKSKGGLKKLKGYDKFIQNDTNENNK